MTSGKKTESEERERELEGCSTESRASYELNIYVLADVGQERGKQEERKEIQKMRKGGVGS